MRSFAAFLLGIIVGVLGTIYFPLLTAHPDQVNAEVRKQLEILQAQVHELGDQLKNFNLPKVGDNNAAKESPSPSASPR